MKKLLLGLGLALVVIIGGIFIYNYITDSKSQNPTYDQAYVRMNVAQEAHPLYKEYERIQFEYENIKAQYEAEKNTNQWQKEFQTNLSGEEALRNSWEKAYEAAIAVKQQEINARLIQDYSLYVHKYQDVWGIEPKESDLRIVNLQLQLLSIPFSPEEKAKKEAELKALLKDRNPSFTINDQALQRRVQEAMAPLRQELDSEMTQYKSHIRQILSQQKGRQEALVNQYNNTTEKVQSNVSWEAAWQRIIEDRKEKALSLKAQITSDIQAKSQEIAHSKDLTLVESTKENKGKALDITDAVVQYFKSQIEKTEKVEDSNEQKN